MRSKVFKEDDDVSIFNSYYVHIHKNRHHVRVEEKKKILFAPLRIFTEVYIINTKSKVNF